MSHWHPALRLFFCNALQVFRLLNLVSQLNWVSRISLLLYWGFKGKIALYFSLALGQPDMGRQVERKW
jgi:hypothetical protein